MPENIATLSAAGGHPEVEIVIGNLQRGDHLIVLFDENDQNGIVVGQSNNGVPVAYRYQIPKPLSQLNQNILRWNCIIGTSSTGEEIASVTVRIIQNGQIVKGGEIITRERITVLGFIKDKARLRVV